eukprot:4496139-Pyramimonas_sp.AAC.1
MVKAALVAPEQHCRDNQSRLFSSSDCQSVTGSKKSLCIQVVGNIESIEKFFEIGGPAGHIGDIEKVKLLSSFE